MRIHCLGVSHNTAAIALRECLAFSQFQLNAALARFGCREDENWKALQEFAILSTCNRVEIYAVANENVFELLETFLSEVHGVPSADFSSATYRLMDAAAVGHLLKVAAGLDSMVLGEPQILGQVTEAYSVARRHGSAGKILSRLFQTAIRAGKRTRTETTIGHNPASISSVAVKMIAEQVADLNSARILVIGAGEMAETAAAALQKRGSVQITVANRTQARAQSLANRFNGQAATLESLPELLSEVDVVITSTGAPHIIINKQMVEAAMNGRPGRPLVLMDIALPRDVDAEVEQISDVRRFDLDSLDAHLEVALTRREAQVPAVERILAEEQQNFMTYLATLDVVPLITEMRQQANAIQEAELEKTLRRMPELSAEAQQQLRLLTASIVKKILHKPTMGLRNAAEDSRAPEYAEVARDLFGLGGTTD